MSATDAAIHNKKNHEPGTTALIVSNEEIEDEVKIVKSLEELGLLIQGISETLAKQDEE